MNNSRHSIPELRPMTDRERSVLKWLLENGTPEARQYLDKLDEISVVSRCACGCPSINFTGDWHGGITILSEYQFDTPDGGLGGVFAFEYEGKLAGIDVWSIDGRSRPTEMPEPSTLVPFGTP